MPLSVAHCNNEGWRRNTEGRQRGIPCNPAPNDLGLWTRFADNVIYGIPERPLDTVTAFLATNSPVPAPATPLPLGTLPCLELKLKLLPLKHQAKRAIGPKLGQLVGQNALPTMMLGN
ncbi:hypothetical protein ACLKA7_013482 [Drosophila subpalustris]